MKMVCMPTRAKGLKHPADAALTSPQARSAPPARPTREVEQEPRDHGEALHQLHWLRLTKYRREHPEPVCCPGCHDCQGDQHQRRPTRPQADDESDRPEDLDGYVEHRPKPFGNGSPLDATDAANFEKCMSFWSPAGSSRAAMNSRPTRHAMSSLRFTIPSPGVSRDERTRFELLGSYERRRVAA